MLEFNFIKYIGTYLIKYEHLNKKLLNVRPNVTSKYLQ